MRKVHKHVKATMEGQSKCTNIYEYPRIKRNELFAGSSVVKRDYDNQSVCSHHSARRIYLCGGFLTSPITGSILYTYILWAFMVMVAHAQSPRNIGDEVWKKTEALTNLHNEGKHTTMIWHYRKHPMDKEDGYAIALTCICWRKRVDNTH